MGILLPWPHRARPAMFGGRRPAVNALRLGRRFETRDGRLVAVLAVDGEAT